jgi:hypothetical protein
MAIDTSHIDIGFALAQIHEGIWYKFENGIKDYDHVTVYEGYEKPTEAEIEAKRQELITSYVSEQEAKSAAKTSGNQKLLDLGLTQEEATALTGYTPSAE